MRVMILSLVVLTLWPFILIRLLFEGTRGLFGDHDETFWAYFIFFFLLAFLGPYFRLALGFAVLWFVMFWLWIFT